MTVSSRDIAKAAVRFVFGVYSPYYIYRSPRIASDSVSVPNDGLNVVELTNDTIISITDALVDEERSYGGHQSICFACFVDNEVVGICFYWFGERYESRGFLRLQANEAKLVQIKVATTMRGRGIARELIRKSAQSMYGKGFRTLYARVWHSNRPSRKAFEAADWNLVAFILEINPLRFRRPIRIRLNLRTRSV